MLCAEALGPCGDAPSRAGLGQVVSLQSPRGQFPGLCPPTGRSLDSDPAAAHPLEGEQGPSFQSAGPVPPPHGGNGGGASLRACQTLAQ